LPVGGSVQFGNGGKVVMVVMNSYWLCCLGGDRGGDDNCSGHSGSDKGRIVVVAMMVMVAIFL
jgi:hypothetical protein